MESFVWNLNWFEESRLLEERYEYNYLNIVVYLSILLIEGKIEIGW